MWWGSTALTSTEVPQQPGPLSVSDAWVDCADGVGLCCRIWRPQGPGPWPALLMRQPYGRAIASTVTYAHPQWYASHGYAVVVQDVRGRGASGGQFQGFSQEASDAARTLGWLRSQGWCNGRVGTYGFSYQGLSQLLHDDPQQLPDALAPAMAGLDERLHWASEGGCHWWALGLAWGLQLAAQGCQHRGDQAGWREIRTSLEQGDFLRDGLELLQRHDPGGMAMGWLGLDPAEPEGWRLHAPPARLWQRPMLLIGGWHDPHLRGVLDLWRRCHQAQGQPLLRIGAWSHLAWRGGVDRLQLAFFDHHLRDRPAAAELLNASALQDLGPNGSWLVRSPQQASGQVWSLHSTGLAAVDAEEGCLKSGEAGPATVVALVHDPWRPLPGRGGHLGLDAGAAERGDLDQRGDVACFSSEPAPGPMELLGQPQLSLRAACDQEGFDLCVALSVLGLDGSVRQISTGVARFLGPECRTPLLRQVSLQPLLLSLRPGERLRLSIGMAAWPQIAVNPGDGSQPQGGSGMGHRIISLELQLAESRLSILPMIDAN